MGLIQKLKSALGLDGAQSPEPGGTSPRDVDVTVEREPSSESEDAVKGTETTASGTAAADEPDAEGAGADEPTQEESLIEEAESTVDDEADPTVDDEAEPEPAEPDAGEPESEDEPESDDEPESGDLDETADEDADDETAEPDSDVADVPDDPVTNINGIGPAYGERLSDAGVETAADLAAADAEELEAATDISAARIEGWIDAAAEY